MPRSKKVGRLEIRVDKELLAALDELQTIYGKDVTKTELIREAVIEKVARDKRKHSAKSGDANA
jgi:metal-responsive CopG/Arc/MetJ family transcriptional regulator